MNIYEINKRKRERKKKTLDVKEEEEGGRNKWIKLRRHAAPSFRIMILVLLFATVFTPFGRVNNRGREKDGEFANAEAKRQIYIHTHKTEEFYTQLKGTSTTFGLPED